jgi:NADPH:quinone reductase-like Zn-dependent oxidoreductase
VKDLKVGDRVVYLCGVETTGCFHTFGRVDQNVVVKIPDHMRYEVACGLPCVYATVIYGLVDAGKLEKGEKILIHAAAGGVGQAAIHYAKYVGAEIFATVSAPEKRNVSGRLYSSHKRANLSRPSAYHETWSCRRPYLFKQRPNFRQGHHACN